LAKLDFISGLTTWLEETAMKMKTVVLAAALALTSTFALAQSAGSTAGGSSKAGGPAATQLNSARGAGTGTRMRRDITVTIGCSIVVTACNKS
jgi:uncharacterized membrane protein